MKSEETGKIDSQNQNYEWQPCVVDFLEDQLFPKKHMTTAMTNFKGRIEYT